MSATRDKSQKTTFVYSNLYQLYRKGVEAAKNAEVPAAPVAPAVESSSSYVTLGFNRTPSSSNVLKARDLKQEAVQPYNPPSLLTKRIVHSPLKTEFKTSVVEKVSTPVADPAIKSLRENLQNLNELHARLRFMLQELEDLVKE